MDVGCPDAMASEKPTGMTNAASAFQPSAFATSTACRASASVVRVSIVATPASSSPPSTCPVKVVASAPPSRSVTT